MKKLVSLIVAIALAGMLTMGTFAQQSYTVVSQTTETFADGSSVVITVSKANNSFARATSTVGGKKDYTFYNGGSVAFVFSVYGTFSVNTGVSSTCTKATYEYTPYQAGWILTSASASPSGNTAKASGSVAGGGGTIYPSVSVSCDKYGNLS